MRSYHRILAVLLAALLAPPAGIPANHREAPITAIDHKADITDVFAFRSYTASGSTAIPMVTLTPVSSAWKVIPAAIPRSKETPCNR